MSSFTTTLASAVFAAVTGFACAPGLATEADGDPDAGLEEPPQAVQIEPSSYDLGDVIEGRTGARATFVVTNTGDTTTPRLRSLLAGGDAHDFELIDNRCAGVPLEPDQTCAVEVRFAPRLSGNELPASRVATLQVDGGDTVLVIVELEGRGLPPGSPPSTSHDSHHEEHPCRSLTP